MDIITKTEMRLRRPEARDGAAVHALVGRCKPLDLNSCYAYLLLCEHFADTCVVAEAGDRLVGFLSAYRPPTSPDAIFVWQVAVDASARSQGLAGRMLDALVEREACEGVRCLETTISPSNAASQRLFLGWAARRNAACRQSELFGAELFGGCAHEAEILYRIGPL